MTIYIDPNVIQNLTATQGNIMPTPEDYSIWCLTQHFANDYNGMYLIAIAIIFLTIHETLLKYPNIKIPEIYLWKMHIFGSEETKEDILLIAKWSIIIFAFMWVYQVKNWHFADAILHLLGAI